MFAPTTGIAGMSGGTHNKLTVDDKYSFSFDGIDEYVDTGLATNDANFSGEFSITCWVKVPSSIPGDHYLLGSRSGDHGIYAYIGNSSGRPAFCLKSEIADSSNALCLTDIRGEGWCLIVNVCKIDNGIYKAFNSVNGSDLDTFNTLGDGFVYNDMTNSNNQLLFKSDQYSSYLEGQMSSIAYFSKALSQDEIDGLYAKTTSPQEIGDLFLYYRMGDRDADSLNPYLAFDDCSVDRTDDWTVTGTMAFDTDHYDVDGDDLEYCALPMSGLNNGDRIKISVDMKGDVGSENVYLGVDNDDLFFSPVGGWKTITDSWATYTRIQTWGYSGSTGYVVLQCSLTISFEMKNFKAELVDDNDDPIGSAHLDAVAGSDGTPYNMEIGDITEDAP